MKLLIDTFKRTGNLHHAYVLEGEHEIVRKDLFDFISEHLKLATIGNPDFWHTIHDSFTIDDARNVRDAQANRPVVGDKKIFIIETRAMTVEAQNSLLKVLEEPTAGTHIFILLPSSEIILPTLRSRAIVVSLRDEAFATKDAQIFLKSSLPERLEIVGEISEEKDKAKAQGLLDGLITELHGKKGKEAALKELLTARMYVNDRSPSLKLLLEHIACILP